MSEPFNNKNEDMLTLDAYLDGQLDAAESARVEQMLASDKELAEQVALQDRIDDSLKRLFVPQQASANLDMDAIFARAAAPETEPVELASASHIDQPRSSRRSVIKNFAVGLAAAAAWVAVLWQFAANQPDSYERVAVVDIYASCVDDGFKPLWVCEDDVEFAQTFQKRQGVPLRLASLPAGREMMGLSYLKGLSENATSMLARVDGKPVLVLVTTLEEEPIVKLGRFDEQDVNVFRTQKLGLAFFEITPFDEPLVSPFLEQAKL